MARASGAVRRCFGNDAEISIDPANGAGAAGVLTAYLTPDVRKVGSIWQYQVRDHLASPRLTIAGSVITRHDDGPYVSVRSHPPCLVLADEIEGT
jgi:hypothetical protein